MTAFQNFIQTKIKHILETHILLKAFKPNSVSFIHIFYSGKHSNWHCRYIIHHCTIMTHLRHLLRASTHGRLLHARLIPVAVRTRRCCCHPRPLLPSVSYHASRTLACPTNCSLNFAANVPNPLLARLMSQLSVLGLGITYRPTSFFCEIWKTSRWYLQNYETQPCGTNLHDIPRVDSRALMDLNQTASDFKDE